MICWGLGAFGLGLTGVLETNTKEDMGQHANFVLLWGANLASQPNTGRHLAAAKHRGARVMAIDVRETEATAHADESLLIRPGTDAALALALMHVIIGEQLHNRNFIQQHTLGFDELAASVKDYTPAWAAGVTGIPAERIVALARAYAAATPAMIVVGGSSMHKGDGSWTGARATAACPGSPATSASRAAASARATAAPPMARRSAASPPRSGARPAPSFRARCRWSPRRCATAACA